MKKNLLSFLLFFIIFSCGSETDISETPIPYSKGVDSLTQEPSDTLPGETLQDSAVVVRLDSVVTDSTEDASEEETDQVETEGQTDTIKVSVPEDKKTDPAPVSKPESKPVKPTTAKPTGPAVPDQKKEAGFRKLSSDAYRMGEKLSFDIRYGIILAGTGMMTVDREFFYQNRIVQRVLFEAKSTAAYSWIYKVEDQYVTYLDKHGIFPWKFIQKIREGSYKKDNEVEFDQLNGVAVEKGKTYKIPPYTHDILSAFYYFRNIDLKNAKPGTYLKLSNYSKGKVHPLDVRIVGWQKVKVPAGTFNCVVLEPLVKAGGLFKNEGTLFVWLTNDQLKIPVKVETKVLIGSITVELSKVEGVNRPIPARTDK